MAPNGVTNSKNPIERGQRPPIIVVDHSFAFPAQEVEEENIELADNKEEEEDF